MGFSLTVYVKFVSYKLRKACVSGFVPAQMRVSVWITIHLCSKELVDVSRMVRKISRKNT